MRLLSRTRDEVLNTLNNTTDPRSISGNEFENLVYEHILKCSYGTEFQNQLKQTSDRSFPDILAAKLYGIEVKATKKDAWESIGNSVLESSREQGVSNIFIFFGKLGGKPDIRVREYEECLKDIAVTHYPRYRIDMNLPSGQSIFDKMQVSYETIRKAPNRTSIIRDYYKRLAGEGNTVWWLDDGSGDAPLVEPVVRTFSDLSKADRHMILADVFVRFPRILSNTSKKYEGVPTYLAARHGVVSHKLRDEFSAGGRPRIVIDGKVVDVPHIVLKLLEVFPLVERALKSSEHDDITEYWDEDDQHENLLDRWLAQVDSHSEYMSLPASLSRIFTRQVNSSEQKTSDG